MRLGLITGVAAAILLFGCAKEPITRAQADAMSERMFKQFLRESQASARTFGAVSVKDVAQEAGNGWWYRWRCRNNSRSALSIVVSIWGTAKITEAPTCAAKR